MFLFFFFISQVRYNHILCKVILGIWSWSLLQFAMVLTATKARKDQSGIFSQRFNVYQDPDVCCTPDVYGIIISIMLQDAPYLCLRLLLIFKYEVVSYTNMFFTCKNTIVILLLMYRLVVVQIERHQMKKKNVKYMSMSESSSAARLMVHSHSDIPYYNSKIKVKLREPVINPNEPAVNYVVRRHFSLEGDKIDESGNEGDGEEDYLSFKVPEEKTSDIGDDLDLEKDELNKNDKHNMDLEDVTEHTCLQIDTDHDDLSAAENDSIVGDTDDDNHDDDVDDITSLKIEGNRGEVISDTSADTKLNGIGIRDGQSDEVRDTDL